MPVRWFSFPRIFDSIYAPSVSSVSFTSRLFCLRHSCPSLAAWFTILLHGQVFRNCYSHLDRTVQPAGCESFYVLCNHRILLFPHPHEQTVASVTFAFVTVRRIRLNSFRSLRRLLKLPCSHDSTGLLSCLILSALRCRFFSSAHGSPYFPWAVVENVSIAASCHLSLTQFA